MRQFLVAVLLVLGLVAAYPIGGGGVIPPSGNTGGGGGATPQDVSAPTVLTGTDNLSVSITGSFDGEITLPAPTTAGQTITITDAAGVGSGDANGASENIIYVEVADTGTQAITAPDLATSRTRLMLWKRYGTLTLLDDGAGGWHALARRGWHVDPRSIAGLEFWFDSRRGITLNGNAVSAWADVSGNNLDVAQATAADQPLYAYAASESRTMHGDHNAVVAFSSDHLLSSSSPVFDSGSLTLFAAFDYDFSRTPGTEIMFRSSLAASLGFFWSVNSSATPGGAPTGNFYIAANNAAVNSYSSVPRNGGANSSIDSHVQWVALRASQSGGGNYRTPQSGSLARGWSGAVSAFTQTIRIFDTIEQCRVGHLMAFDADLSVADIADLESALIEVWPRG